ncbi:MAG: alpha/beta hydrolase fold domain-containing protein [Sphingomonas sp.]
MGDLSGLPPTYIAVGALDLFVEEDMEYARRLVRAGVPTALHIEPGVFHGFQIAGPDTPQARQHAALARAAFARAFAAAAPAVTEPA